jgi:hypothetical protein
MTIALYIREERGTCRTIFLEDTSRSPLLTAVGGTLRGFAGGELTNESWASSQGRCTREGQANCDGESRGCPHKMDEKRLKTIDIYFTKCQSVERSTWTDLTKSV